MHQALYRKWRPQVFDDVYGQEHITSILKYETENNTFSHAYLFCGSRGTGKTTCAKILAKAVNCEFPVNGSPCNRCESCRAIDAGTATDVLEMDAASNNGVDNIRDIRDEVVYMPSALKYRVYIVDEVHMLSGSAFNALLKTLEEPPSHVIFILATTELHKLPATIVSRCQRYDFRRIKTDTLISRLSYIADQEGIATTQDGLRIIAKMAQGGMRDAISLLELCASSRERLTPQVVNETLGIGGRGSTEEIVKAVAKRDFDEIFRILKEIVMSSKDIAVFMQDILAFYRDMLVIKTTRAAKEYLDLTDDEAEHLKSLSECFTKETLIYHCRVMDDTLLAMQKAGAGRVTIAEMAFVKMCDDTLDESAGAILSRLSKLENSILLNQTASLPRATLVSDTPHESENTDKQTVAAADKSEASIKRDSVKAERVSAVSEQTSHGAQQSTLKPFRGWNEVAERAAVGSESYLGFLKTARAFVDGDGRIYIRFPNEFARTMVQKSGIVASLCSAFSSATQRKLGTEQIVLEIFHGDEDSISELEDLQL